MTGNLQPADRETSARGPSLGTLWLARPVWDRLKNLMVPGELLEGVVPITLAGQGLSLEVRVVDLEALLRLYAATLAVHDVSPESEEAVAKCWTEAPELRDQVKAAQANGGLGEINAERRVLAFVLRQTAIVRKRHDSEEGGG